MDEVKWLIIQPQIFRIVDQELQIGRHQSRLTRAKINPNYLARGKVVCELDGPDSGAGTNVEAPFRIVNGREEQSVAECQTENVMLEI